MVSRKISLVIPDFGVKSVSRSVKIEKVISEVKVRTAKRVPPRLRQPKMNNGRFPRKDSSPTGQPAMKLMICATPLIPPLDKSAGTRNNRMANDWAIEPRRTNR
jgi:hypothetical protein